MKTEVLFWMAILFVLTSVVRADEGSESVRDPFWPVGYRPLTQTNLTAEVKTVEEVKPVEPEEWDDAKAKIPRPAGIFIGAHPVSRAMVDKMVLGGKTYYAGDQICLTNEFVAFTWKIDSVSFKETKYELSPVSAERVLTGKK